MSIEKISSTLEEFLGKILKTCDELDIKYIVNRNNNCIQINISRTDLKSILRIYQKKDGVKLDTSVGRDKSLNSEIETKIKNDLSYTSCGDYTYKYISKEQIKNIYKNLSLLQNEYNLIERINKNSSIDKIYDIKNINTNEKVTVTFYNNSSIRIQGIVWNLWEDICQLIECSSTLNKSNIINRLLEQSVDNVVDYMKEIAVADTCQENNNIYIFSDDFTIEEKELKKILTDKVYEYLKPIFIEYLESAYRIIYYNIPMKEYSTVLCPTAKVLEGYLKKLLVDLKIVRKIQMNPKWRFSNVFSNNKILLPDGIELTQNQEIALNELYILVRDFRHKEQHGSLKPQLVVRNIENCCELFYKITKSIRESYYNIF